ncbi:MAG TPA: hypothetical protein VHU88_23780 [Sporichthyaceae bacterium]|jgi:hypothetical protein|nr:hypothetical protein [Sporichthyaceae bacterium]
MGRFALGLLLSTLGEMLKVASRVSERFRAQVTEDLTIEVASTDGVAHHYVFRAANRSVASRRGRAPGTPDLALEFRSAALGFRTLVRTDAIGEIMKLLHARRATYTGNAVYVLWFWSLRSMVLPYGRDRRLPGAGLPGALTAPDPASKVADRITRGPAVAALDPSWTAALAARDRMAMLRRIRGEDVPMW